MGWIKELDDLMTKNKTVKVLVIISLIVIIVAFGSFSYVFIKTAYNGQIDIGTVKVSPKHPEEDSFRPTPAIIKPGVPTDTKQKSATSNNNKEKNQNNSNLKRNTATGNPKNKSAPTATNGKNINNGINNGSIGDNNTNYLGKKKQHPDARLLHQIDSAFKNNKEDPIEIMAVISGAGSADFANELGELMKQIGYKKVSVGTGQLSPLPQKGISVDNSFGTRRLLVNFD